MNRRKELIDIIWQYIKKYNQNMKKEASYAYSDLRVTKKEISESVFYREGEHRISGEEGNKFSLFFVNYWDGMDSAIDMMDYLGKHGWDAEWYNPGYMVAYKR